MEKSEAIAAVCNALSDGAHDQAVTILREHYPFAPDEGVNKRRYGPVESIRVFVRDGFIDRYSGKRLIFLPVFRILSVVLASDFPYHSNWKTDVTHAAYWEIAATVDHLVPVTRGGRDEESNFITTSMARNFAKMNWTIEEIGWELHPPGDLAAWDGLIHWFVEYATRRPETVPNSSVHQWLRAARVVLSGAL